ncbi:hypothetical protein ACEPPN_002175 [Leptodophora sp. 'Broadleaf-Isolate-01']
MDRFDSNSLTPSHRQHSKNAEKQTARQIREAQQQYLTFHSKRLCHHSDWDYIRSHAEDFPFQREAEPAKESILALKNNQTYSQSVVALESSPWAVRGLGRGAFRFRLMLIILVALKGQGWKCSVRVGGVKIPPRRQRADLFQSSAFTHTHLGSKHDLNTTTGCADARQELQGIMNQLSHENARHNEDDDDDIYVGPDDRKSIPQTTSPRRTRQNGKAIAPTSSRAAVVALDDDGDDDGDYVASSNLPPISQARRTRRSSTSPARHSRSGIGIAVVIPSFQPPHKRFRRKTSSFNF